MGTGVIWAERALLPGGWAEKVRLELRGGRIFRISPGVAPEGVRRDLLLPAPVNLHSHAFQRAMAGMTEARGPDPRDTFWTWRQLMFRFLDQLTPEDVEAIAAFVQMEMLEAGFAAVAEFHYLHHRPGGAPYADPAEMSGRIAAAAEATGIGLTLLPVLYSQGGCDGRALGPGQVRFGNDPERFARLWQAAKAALGGLADARIGVAPHSLRAVSRDGLAEVVAAAGGHPIHMHLAEQVAEVEEVLAAYGARPVEWLLAQHEVGPRWCLIHCTQMRPAETRALAATGAVAGLCPITEANLGDGIFDGVRYLGAGGRFGVGSDSNIRISLAEELRQLEYSQRLRDRGRAVLARPDRSTGRVLFQGAVQGGAQAAGRESGAIAEGLWADLVALDAGHADLAMRRGDGLLDAWIFAGDDRMVTDTWAAGRHMVTGGRHRDRAAITARYRAATARLGDLL
ncbi:N-formimino-L-glutamate deiminase [Defluviimonas sp. 20V17]|uniref:Formimidoylglutamate deiminase n=1 Tax=Allgaiera indica TaxID=765699 RepID=A0AAN4UQI2_9RHOB|nr:formimidoylglutamate deiminase [Allgaiera indica]KDB02818.1 N-formimino-L-glutamate deiminase [Defluviimonas sp. 20V17]GHE01270.1 formimidoylglutamate deiminase [Allgaiera indica]SDW83809.1 formimidoylglutamate deiminase [Allgaiera indica]